ncbi:hypothetical protein niasHT_017272 [Heterodera trifolii]|uniref:Lon proteolytic domain-containing protein n=1 Tax=Heterodera trifolii TaxID=157864 RepID=A0ABD2LGR1_9BILA
MFVTPPNLGHGRIVFRPGVIIGISVNNGTSGVPMEVNIRINSHGQPGQYSLINDIAPGPGETVADSVHAIANAYTVARQVYEHRNVGGTFFAAKHIEIVFEPADWPISGGSCSAAAAIALLSKAEKELVRVDTVVSGGMLPNGLIGLVSGLALKIEGSRQYNMRRILLPSANFEEVAQLPPIVTNGIEIVFRANIWQIMADMYLSMTHLPAV